MKPQFKSMGSSTKQDKIQNMKSDFFFFNAQLKSPTVTNSAMQSITFFHPDFHMRTKFLLFKLRRALICHYNI